MKTTQTTKDSSGRTWEILPEDYTQYDLSFKIIVIGNSGVGKSCLTTMATKSIFEERYKVTVGFEFFCLNLRTDKQVIKLQIWDTCGQELYRSLITNFYRNSSCAIMVYSIDNHQTFDDIDIWLKELRMHSNPDTKVFLIGNKTDLEPNRKVTTDEGEKYMKNFNLNFFMESSAKTGLNAQAIFVEVAKTLYEDYAKYRETSDKAIIGSFKPFTSNGSNNQHLSQSDIKKKPGCSC